LASADTPHVDLIGISKRFGGVQALDDITLAIGQGTIHALVGENGAGKSTLGRIVAGIHPPDGGELRVDGQPVHYRAPHDALKDGITTIAQELALLPARRVIDNVFLGSEHERYGFLNERSMRKRYRELSTRAGFDLPADARVGRLRLADQQKVEILRALARNAKLIVVDEPTAALTADEAEKLLLILRALRSQGTTIVYVSHFLSEVLSVADAVTVLRDGKLIRTSLAESETPETLITAMLGRSVEMTFPDKTDTPPDAAVVLSVKGLSRPPAIRDISFDVRAGEIVGLAGLIGSGRTEVARAIFGADRLTSGEVTLDGRRMRIRSPHRAISAGIAMLPESRKDQGLLMRSSIVRNVSLAHLDDVSPNGWVMGRRERARVRELTTRVDVRASRLTAKVSSLSGGNQQKVLFAKWLFRPPRVLIADEPTRGVDVGAKRAIYELIHSLAANGMAVVFISSELEEVIGMAHRIFVLRAGEIVGEYDGRTATEDELLRAAFAAEAAAA
jgi:simple sugar transport system ATP-binding protein/ribose transport system ATP-binding protein